MDEKKKKESAKTESEAPLDRKSQKGGQEEKSIVAAQHQPLDEKEKKKEYICLAPARVGEGRKTIKKKWTLGLRQLCGSVEE